MIPMPGSYQPYADWRKVDFGMSFGVIAVDAATLAEPSSSAQYPTSQIEQTHDHIELTTAKYTTLEHNMWVLDGTMQLYPDNLSGIQTGWISEDMSGEDRTYESGVHLTFEFSEPQDSYGLTFVFDQQMPEEIPAEIKVTFYSEAGAELYTKRDAPYGAYHWMDAPVQQYSKVMIDFLSSKIPNRRIRVTEVIFGIVTVYDRKTIVDASDKQSIDLLSESLPSATVTIKIDNQDKLYNLINPEGIYEYLQDGQYINYWVSVGGTKVNMGVRYFYAAESDDGGLTATITFNDRMIFLDDVIFNGGASGTWTLKEAVETILIGAGIKTAPTFEDGLDGVVIRKCIPQDTTCREALRLCAQAAMCVCYVDRNDSPHFIRPQIKMTPDDQLTRDRLSEEPVVDIGDRYNAVTIRRRDDYVDGSEEETYTKSAAAEDEMILTKEISNPLVNDMVAWCDWALPWVQRRTSFDIEYRGNPALEMGDTVQVYDAFGVNGSALVESHELTFDGGMDGSMKARR